MAIVKVEKNSYTVEPLYQWDHNQVLEIRGLSLPSVPEIHFTNEAMDRAIVRQASMDNAGIVSVYIPNSLLQKPYKITAYVCIYTGATFESLYKIEIPVKARTQPNDYSLMDDEESYSFKALENVAANALHNSEIALENTNLFSQQSKIYTDNKVTDSINTALPAFLDSTLTMTDKAAQAAVVGTKLSSLDVVVRGLVEGRTPVATGSYVGTGEFTGSGSTITEGETIISFSSPPKLVFVQGEAGDSIIAIQGQQKSFMDTGEAVYLTWNGNSVSMQFYENHTAFKGYSPALSQTGKTYSYMAIL